MLSGSRLSVDSQATAEIANTISPRITHGDVMAFMTSDESSSSARSVASVMPCLSSTCPAAAENTAKSRNAKLDAVTERLPTDTELSVSSGVDGSSWTEIAGSGPVSGSFDNKSVLRVRGQPQNELVAEQRRSPADQPGVELADELELDAVGVGHDAEWQTRVGLFHDVEAAAANEPAQRRPGEEPQVGLVEDAAPVVAEQAEHDPGPRVPVAEV